MTPLLGPARAFDLALGDLDAVAPRLPVMHDEAWCAKRPDRDRPTPHRDPSAGPDEVKASRWDCGLADERARQTWGNLVDHLRTAEGLATKAHYFAKYGQAGVAPADLVRLAAALSDDVWEPAYRPTSLLDVQAGVLRLKACLTSLHALWAKWSTDAVPHANWLARALGGRDEEQGTCFYFVKQARHDAQHIVPIVGTGKAPATCTQCRRLGSIGQPRIGGVCFACDKRNQRAGLPRRTTVVVRQRRATLKAKRRDVA